MDTFQTFDHAFCESSVYGEKGSYPEYISAFTALLICFIGVNGLVKPNLSVFTSLFYGSLLINGLTSFFYHLFHSIGFGLMDRLSMILIVFTSILLFTQQLPSTLQIILNTVLLAWVTIMLVVTSLHMLTLFTVLFGVYLIIMCIYVVFIQVPSSIKRFAWIGIALILSGAFIWIITEQACHSYDWVKYIFGHAIWHVAVSFGGYLISLLPQYQFLSATKTPVIQYDVFGIPYLS